MWFVLCLCGFFMINVPVRAEPPEVFAPALTGYPANISIEFKGEKGKNPQDIAKIEELRRDWRKIVRSGKILTMLSNTYHEAGRNPPEITVWIMRKGPHDIEVQFFTNSPRLMGFESDFSVIKADALDSKKVPPPAPRMDKEKIQRVHDSLEEKLRRTLGLPDKGMPYILGDSCPQSRPSVPNVMQPIERTLRQLSPQPI